MLATILLDQQLEGTIERKTERIAMHFSDTSFHLPPSIQRAAPAFELQVDQFLLEADPNLVTPGMTFAGVKQHICSSDDKFTDPMSTFSLEDPLGASVYKVEVNGLKLEMQPWELYLQPQLLLGPLDISAVTIWNEKYEIGVHIRKCHMRYQTQHIRALYKQVRDQLSAHLDPNETASRSMEAPSGSSSGSTSPKKAAQRACFPLTRLDDAGESVTVMAYADENGEIQILSDSGASGAASLLKKLQRTATGRK